MMEFTLSRVCAGICGAILLSTVFTPSLLLFENDSEDRFRGMVDSISGTVERFHRSEAETLTLDLGCMIPGGSRLCFEGYTITLEHNGRTYTSGVSFDLGTRTFHGNDVIRMEKTDDGTCIVV